jgi:hypothetical protein
MIAVNLLYKYEYLLFYDKLLFIFDESIQIKNIYMTKKTNSILAAMHVLAWVTFFGLCIKAGAILFSFGVSLLNPEGARNLYLGLNLFNLKQLDFGNYVSIVLLLVAITMLEAYIAYLVARVLSKIKLQNPFTIEISRLLEKISYSILATWVVVMIYDLLVAEILKKIPESNVQYISGEFIFFAGVVFVISQIFKKGVEIQTENELTV